MKLLTAAYYDPAAAVTKATATLQVMTALDTTNLRVTFTIPSSGIVRARINCAVHGATTVPHLLLGFLSGSTVVARVAPRMDVGGGLLATSLVATWADFCITGLTPGSATWDLAYGVETVGGAATGIKYGGPNNTTGNDAFGAISFEIYDAAPQPQNYSALSITAGGVVKADIETIKTQAVTCAAGVTVLASVGTASTSTAQTGDAYARIGASGAGLTAIGDTRLVTLVNLDTTVSSRSTYAGGDTSGVTTLLSRIGSALTITSGAVNANVTHLLGTAWLTPGTAGTPDVNVKLWNGLTTVALPLAPTTAGRTLDVSASGNVQLSSTGLANVTSWTCNIIGSITGNLSGTVGGVGAQVDITQLAADKVWLSAARTLTAGTNIVLPSNGLSAITAWTTNITGNLSGSVGSVTGAVGSVTGLTASNLDVAVSTLATAANLAAVKAKTDQFVFTIANQVDSNALTGGGGGSGLDAAGVRAAIGLASANLDTQLAALPTAEETADATLLRDMSVPTVTSTHCLLNAIRILRNPWSIDDMTGVLTVMKEDGTTTAWTATVTGTAGADPVTAIG